MASIGWEWIAGFFEGEGHIYWQEGKRGTKQGAGGRLIIGQKDRRPLDAIFRFLADEGFSKPQFYLRPAGKDPRSTACWILSVCRRQDVLRMLTAMLPFLFQKADKARSVCEKIAQLQDDRRAILEEGVRLKESGLTWREVARRLHVQPQTIMNHARGCGLDLKRYPKFDDDMGWKRDRKDRGLCVTCGKKRGKKGTAWYCRSCADKINALSREWKRKARAAKK